MICAMSYPLLKARRNGGNMRYRAMKELGIKEAPCKVIPQDTTIEQLQAYTLKDNSGYGEWEELETIQKRTKQRGSQEEW